MAKYKIEILADYLGHTYDIEHAFDSDDLVAWEQLRKDASHHWSGSDLEDDIDVEENGDPLKWLEMYVTIEIYEHEAEDPVPSMRGWEQRAFFGKVFDANGKLVGEYDIDFS